MQKYYKFDLQKLDIEVAKVLDGILSHHGLFKKDDTLTMGAFEYLVEAEKHLDYQMSLGLRKWYEHHVYEEGIGVFANWASYGDDKLRQKLVKEYGEIFKDRQKEIVGIVERIKDKT